MDRTIRLSQTVAPFGVGAIYDYRGESLVAADITKWGGAGERVILDRLADDLSVKQFRSAPARWSRFSAPAGRLPFVRFPRWLFCPTCRRMVLWTDKMEETGEPARCTSCPRRPQLVPMRFVVTCKEGHLGDVQWDRWAHIGAEKEEQKQCRSKNLRFDTKSGSGTGLDALVVRCLTCKAGRSLQGITNEVAHPAIRCSGKQPWEYVETPRQCPQPTPVVLQRGASNLYFAEVRSAIDIPPDSDFDVYSDSTVEVTNAPEFEILKSTDDDLLRDLLVNKIAKRLEIEEAVVGKIAAAAVAEIEGKPAVAAQLTGDLRRDEWNALVTERHGQDERNRFITRHARLVESDEATPPAHELLADKVAQVVLVTRLREVRALKGFRRYDTEGTEVKPALDKATDWLPAIEVYGEGIFLAFREGPLQTWERDPRVVQRITKLEQRRQGSLVGQRVKVASPRFVLLHTFAHLLIRRLAFECGYTAASLRERIYSAESGGEREPFAGVLIYTAAGDSEGTLGGLVRQGRFPRMVETVMAMLEDAAWCSSDPICIESEGQGFQALNRGACHACSLVAETSCEFSNALLDRGVVIGQDAGYFTGVVDAALYEAGAGGRAID